MDSLIVIRDQIDRLDREMVALLDHRTALAAKLAKVKKDEGYDVFDPDREKQVLSKVKRYAKEPVVQQHIEELYVAVMRLAKIKQIAETCDPSPFNHIGIIGRGMMGGSIHRALKQANPGVEVVFVDDVSEVPPSMDLLILAIPTLEVLKLTPTVAKSCSNITVIDIASTKQSVCELFEMCTSGTIEFVGTHPMAGSEKSGIKHSSGDLFIGCRWVITPHENNRPKTLALVEQLIQNLQADVIYLNAKSHDEKIGLVSHMARVVSSSLYAFVLEKNPMSLELAGPGFTSMTRLAKGNQELLDEMIHFNRENIVEHLGGMIDFLTKTMNKLAADEKDPVTFEERVS